MAGDRNGERRLQNVPAMPRNFLNLWSCRPRPMRHGNDLPLCPIFCSLQFATAFALCAIAGGLILAGRTEHPARRRQREVAGGSGASSSIASVAAVREEGHQRFRPTVATATRSTASATNAAASSGPPKASANTSRPPLLDRYRSGSTVKVHYDPPGPAWPCCRPATPRAAPDASSPRPPRLRVSPSDGDRRRHERGVLIPARLALPQALDAGAALLALERRSFEALVGLVARRGIGRTAASWISATSRSSASARLRSWVRWFCAMMTSTPSLVSRLPASRISRIAHVVRQRRRAAHVEAQLHRGRELVDVLPAGTGGAHEALLDLAVVDADAGR